MYINRKTDAYLRQWAERAEHKPILLRGARQVGKSATVKHLGEMFDSFVEINFERNPEYKSFFAQNLDVKRIVPQISAMTGKTILPGHTLLFLDEIQECPQAIMALRFFWEDMPALHVMAAGSLLEFALKDLPTYGVGRIHSMWVYPLTFDEFAGGLGETALLEARDATTATAPLPQALHQKLVELLRTYMLVGGMPECVATWVSTHDYLRCQEVQDDILMGYENDFAKYRQRIDTLLLRRTLRSCALQATQKFVCAQVGGEYRAAQVHTALELLTLAGLVIPVTHTAANGVPLSSSSNNNARKMLLIDTGLMLRLLHLEQGNASAMSANILTLPDADLVNKGAVAEMLFGLEYLHHAPPHLRHELFYWTRSTRNSIAEVDYITVRDNRIVPIEVKAARQGGMKSLWTLMAEKQLTEAVRCSLENFGEINYSDTEHQAIRHVRIVPLYAVGSLWN